MRNNCSYMLSGDRRVHGIYDLVSKRYAYIFRTCKSDVEHFNDEVCSERFIRHPHHASYSHYKHLEGSYPTS